MHQPRKKSFEFYIQTWYEFASWEKMQDKEMKFLEKISDIDTSIIKIDDILDDEEYRNWKKCIHLIDGVNTTIINAKLDEISWIKWLTELIDFKNIFPEFGYKILKKISTEYMYWIYKWQEIDSELENTDMIDSTTLEKYLKMSEMFTWWHIRYWLEIWQLLANKEPDKNISLVALQLWIIRQIVDDFEDYFKAHHNPFWDIRQWRKRLPEIIFILNNGDRDDILRYIKEKDFIKVINEVLSISNRRKMYNMIKSYLEIIKSIDTDLNVQKILVDYHQILTREI